MSAPDRWRIGVCCIIAEKSAQKSVHQESHVPLIQGRTSTRMKD